MGGAIYNSGTIYNIVGDFIGNYTSSSSSYSYNSSSTYSVGGAIYNTGKIENIVGTITDNYAKSTNISAQGGAIYNGGTMAISFEDSITRNFVQSDSGSAQGGFLYNKGTTDFGGMDIDIVNNYAESNSGSAQGGAIYNKGIIESIGGNITGNYAKSTNSTAQGGAIYNTGTMTISADNSISLIKDNYVEDKNGKRNEAIYMGSSSAQLTLNAINGGSIEVYDIITGSSGYDLTLTGDGTGSVSLFNDITNADVIANNVDVVLANGTTKDYSIKTLTSDDTAGWNIDFDITNRKADKIITSSSSNGFVVIDNLNIISGAIADLATDQTNNPFKVQILQTSKDSLQLLLSDEVQAQLGDNEYIIG